jgi:hypothetical protein
LNDNNSNQNKNERYTNIDKNIYFKEENYYRNKNLDNDNYNYNYNYNYNINNNITKEYENKNNTKNNDLDLVGKRLILSNKNSKDDENYLRRSIKYKGNFIYFYYIKLLNKIKFLKFKN